MAHASYTGTVQEMKTEIISHITNSFDTLFDTVMQAGVGHDNTFNTNLNHEVTGPARDSDSASNWHQHTTRSGGPLPGLQNLSATTRRTAASSTLSVQPPPTPTSVTHHPVRTNSTSESRPTAGLYIPCVRGLRKVSNTRSKSDVWKEVVRHWDSGLPELDLHLPLKDWPEEWWARGANRLKFGVLRHNRGVIAKEFLDV